MITSIITADSGREIDLDAMADELNINTDDTVEMPTFVSKELHKRFNKWKRDVAIDMVRLGYI